MIGLIIGVLGVLLTIIFGIYPIFISKKNKKEVSLKFSKKECFSLFDNIIKRLNIEIKYNQNQCDNSLIFLKASILNSGKSDIDKNVIFEPLKIILSDNYKWLEFKVINNPSNFNVISEMKSETEIILMWDLLKKGEEIEFEALVEDLTQKNDEFSSARFYDSISFNFRITNLNKIDKEESTKEIIYIKNWAKTYFVLGLFYLLLGIFFLIEPYVLPKKYLTEYQVKYNNVVETGFIKAISNNEIEFRTNSKNIIIPIDTLKTNNSIFIVRNIQDNNNMLIINYIFFAFFLAGTIFLFKRSYKKYNEYKNELLSIKEIDKPKDLI